MVKGLEVRNILFGELRKITSEEFSESTGMDWTWDEPVDGAEVKLILANSSAETKKAYIYTVTKADIPTVTQTSWGSEVELEPEEQKEINYLVPMHGISSSEYRDYTGPLRHAVSVTVSETAQWEVILKRVKYYDVPARIAADDLEEAVFDVHEAVKELEKTTILHDLHVDGNPKEGIKSVEAKLSNYGETKQYVGIDIRAERKGSGWQTQLFYEVPPKEEMPIDIGGVITSIPTEEELRIKGCGTMVIRPSGIEYLRIRAAGIPAHVFLSKSARAWFLWRSYEEEGNYKSLIAKFDFYFKHDE